jgi:hypothetical protein
MIEMDHRSLMGWVPTLWVWATVHFTLVRVFDIYKRKNNRTDARAVVVIGTRILFLT